jgi:signal transduction histidine kinase
MKFFKSLVFKIIFTILLIEATALSVMGYYYLARFSREIDRGVVTRAMLPGTLVSQRALSYEAIEDKKAMYDLVREEVVESILVRRDGVIFYASDAAKRNKKIVDVLSPGEFAVFEKAVRERHASYRTDEESNLLSVASPIMHGGDLLGCLLLKVNITGAVQEKQGVAVLFMLGSLVCMIGTTVIAVWMIHRLVIPRIRLTDACLEKVKQGDYSARIKNVTGNDELSELQGGVNAMAERIESNIRELNDARMELERAFGDLRSTQSQLIQSEKMAGIGQLAAGVAQEINNPVSFVISNLYILQMYSKNIIDVIKKTEEVVRSKGAQAQEDFKQIYDEAQVDGIRNDLKSLIEQTATGADRIKSIIKSLRDFAHPSGEEFKLDDLNAILEEALSSVWNEVKYKAAVKKELGIIPQVFCNRGRMEQAFVNILLNAVQAIEKDGEIVLRTYSKDDFVFVEIHDNGCGIAPENLGQIFQPFFTTKEAGKGTGLGLSIVYGIVQGHGGTILVKSAPGKGSTFTVKIPTDRRQE